MHRLQPPRRATHRTALTILEETDQEMGDEQRPEGLDDLAEVEALRVVCPECNRPIALGAHDEPLPRHALCSTPFNPFGLTVCPGSGLEPNEAGWVAQVALPSVGDALTLAALPEGLDWRLQPFSHAAGPAPALRQAA
ncbi:hypothetical protein [Streptomyces profundus]|uniref:hypothetical protein n=1 Tax=Streptomyces profundus TaxID=2867410 RepID=UPI001D164B64|nr:hypothetical protein [Streptomyces sp. MA3_2.13]UED82921.1 hypothetical protein K4G22_00900 [Streptomyces sp. MA3_2.13]